MRRSFRSARLRSNGPGGSRLPYAVGIALTIAACTSVTEPSETPLTGTTLYYGPSDRFLPLLATELQVFSGGFRFRHSFIYPHSGHALSASLARRGVDTLAVEVRARERSGNFPQWVWRYDYEYESGPLPAGIYSLRWSEVLFTLRLKSNQPLRFDTLRREWPVLDTVITIPPA